MSFKLIVINDSSGLFAQKSNDTVGFEEPSGAMGDDTLISSFCIDVQYLHFITHAAAK